MLSLTLPALSAAQGVDIRGIVSDSSSGEKIPYANVVIQNANKGAATNMNGFYLIASVVPGTYKIAAGSIGYQSKTKTITVSVGQPMLVNFELASKPVEFSEVVVTDRVKRELTEINTSVHVIDQRDIRLVPAAAMEDVFRSIKILPGIVSTSDVNSQFYVRGGAGDQNLILLDGMRVYNPYHAFGIFSIFDSDIIKTTEVYTGAFPPGFGGRLSSVVNMTTRDGRANAVSGRTNINFLSTKLQLEGPAPANITWLVDGRKSLFANTFKTFLNKDVPLSFYDAFAKVTVRGDLEEKYSFQTFFSGDDLNADNPEDPNYQWRNQAIGFVAAGLIQDRVYIQAVGFENSFTARRDPKLSKTITPASTRLKETGIRTNATFYTNSRDLYFFGFEFNFPSLEYNLVNTYGTARKLSSSFVETSMWFRYQTTSGNWQFDGGFHIDVSSLIERTQGIEVLQPRLNLSYALFNNWRVKGSYGRFTQNIITVNNEDDVISVFDAWIQVPTELKSQEADHFVLGFDGNVIPALSASFQWYYKYYSSLVSYNRDKVDALDPDYINSKGRAYGFETLLRYGNPWVDLYAAYTLGWTTITARGFTYYPRYDRRHNLNLLGVLHLSDGLDCTLRWEVGSGFPFTQTIGYYDRLNLQDVFQQPFVGETGNPYAMLGEKNGARLPAYHRLDASATYRFEISSLNGNVGLHIINLYDHKNVFYFDRKTGQRVDMLPFFPTVTLNLEY